MLINVVIHVPDPFQTMTTQHVFQAISSFKSSMNKKAQLRSFEIDIRTSGERPFLVNDKFMFLIQEVLFSITATQYLSIHMIFTLAQS